MNVAVADVTDLASDIGGRRLHVVRSGRGSPAVIFEAGGGCWSELWRPAIHFHDLRHTGNSLTANAGANLRELMARMGHASTRAALVYLHSTDERQREIATSLERLVQAGLVCKPASRGEQPTGTQRARRTTTEQ
jgi:integrase